MHSQILPIVKQSKIINTCTIKRSLFKHVLDWTPICSWHFLTPFTKYSLAVWVLGNGNLEAWYGDVSKLHLKSLGHEWVYFLEVLFFALNFHPLYFVFWDIESPRPKRTKQRTETLAISRWIWTGWRGHCCTTTTRTYTSKEEGGVNGKPVGRKCDC